MSQLADSSNAARPPGRTRATGGEVIAHGTEDFRREAIPTERMAWECLSGHPIPGVNYFATPWSVHLNRDRLERGSAEVELEGGFTICQHIRYREILPSLKSMGIDVLFTPHAEPAEDFTVLPFPHYAMSSSDPRPKQLLYSFIGCDTHACRGPLFALPRRSDVVIRRREAWHFDRRGPARWLRAREYRRTLAVSRFSLCPRGTGPSTLRFWESLRAGAIPVLISDTALLPAGCDWEACVVRVPEAEAGEVDQVIRSIEPEREAALRKAALAAYRQFSGENLVSCVRLHYAQAAGNRAVAD